MGLFQKAQPDLAILFGKQAVNVLQGIRRDNRGLDEELRRSYEKLIESNYRSLADLMIERDRFGEAEEVLNLLKDQAVASFIRRDSITDQLRPATLLDFERKALERYDHVVNQIVVLGQQKSYHAVVGGLGHRPSRWRGLPGKIAADLLDDGGFVPHLRRA